MKNKNDKEMTQEELLEYELTSNPDIIVVGEMKSAEAFSAQEGARTGHGVLTTHKGYGSSEWKRKLQNHRKEELVEKEYKELINNIKKKQGYITSNQKRQIDQVFLLKKESITKKIIYIDPYKEYESYISEEDYKRFYRND